MPAGVVKGAHLAVAAAYHRDGVVADLQGEVLAGLFQLEGMAGEDPFPVPDLLQVLAVDFRRAIHRPGKRMALFALVDEVYHSNFVVHCYLHSGAGSVVCRCILWPAKDGTEKPGFCASALFGYPPSAAIISPRLQ
ncbi:hypothetical protein D9M72_605730 [compost metagenome]